MYQPGIEPTTFHLLIKKKQANTAGQKTISLKKLKVKKNPTFFGTFYFWWGTQKAKKQFPKCMKKSEKH